MTARSANPWFCRAVEAAAHILPAADRQRYALEFIAELYDMPLSQQVRHSAQLLAHAWALRTALAESGHPKMEETMTLTTARPLACRLGRHRWHWISIEDTRFQCCLVCGQEKTVQLWNAKYNGSMGGGWSAT